MSVASLDDTLAWRETGERRIAYRSSIFNLVESNRHSHDGRRSQFLLVDSPDWANVIAVTQNESGIDCFVLARQYRQGGQCITLEFPGGIVSHGEDPKEAALRELEEETGYTADSLTLLQGINPNPAFMTNTVFTFVAEGVSQRDRQRLDENEIVAVQLVPVSEIEGTPEFYNHAVMVASLYLYVNRDRTTDS